MPHGPHPCARPPLPSAFSAALGRWWACVLVLVVGWLTGLTAWADDGVRLQRLPAGWPLEGQVEVLADPDGTLTIDDVRAAARQGRFSRPADGVWVPGDDAVLWLRIVLQAPAPGGDWLLALPTTALGDVTLHGPFDAGGRALAPPRQTGLRMDFDTRPLASERPVFDFALPAAGTYTLYLRVQTAWATQLTPRLWHPVDYVVWRQAKRLFDGMAYGVLLALFVYNLVLASVLRDRTYAYYVMTCGFAALTLATFNGHAAHYLWPSAVWWIEHSYVLMPALWMAASGLFARSFLGTAGALPGADRLVRGLVGLATVSAVLGLFGRLQLAQWLNEGLSAGGALAMTAVALVRWRQGYRPALWYLAGQGALFAMVIALVLVNQGVLHAPFVLANGLQIGVVAELVVFAIALSRRIRALQERHVELGQRAADLAEAAATDPLTGLANRTGLTRAAQPLLGGDGEHALMLLDLDRFKPVNDRYGHECGDRVLQTVARRLQQHVRDTDTVARLGGDEFVILLRGQRTPDTLQALGERLAQAVAEPIRDRDVDVTVGGSIGIARYPQDGRQLPELLRAADGAMYRAKRGARRAVLAGTDGVAPAVP